MQDFVSIDLEMANSEASSICAIGMVFVSGGEVVDSFYSLVKPMPNMYCFFNSRVSGITYRDTRLAPRFPDVWKQIAPKIDHLPFVAYNKASDEKCLKAAFKRYNMRYPNYVFYCTYQAALKQLSGKVDNFKLSTVANYCGYQLQHQHNALADAEACAAIALKLL